MLMMTLVLVASWLLAVSLFQTPGMYVHALLGLAMITFGLHLRDKARRAAMQPSQRLRR